MSRIVDLPYFFIEQPSDNEQQIGLFDARALKIGESWLFNSVAIPFDKSQPLASFPRVIQKVEEGISTDIHWNRGHLIEMVQISDLYALVAWAQEKWSLDLFSQGLFTGQELLIIMELAGENRNVSIKSQRDLVHNYATLDKSGNVIA